MKRSVREMIAIVVLSGLGLSGLSGQVLQSQSKGDYREALDLYEQEQYANAQERFDAVLRQQGSQDRQTLASAHYYAARCAMELYNGDAPERVEQFAQRFPSHSLKDLLYLHYANNLFNKKRYRQAAEFYAQVDAYSLSTGKRDEFTFKKAYALLQNDNTEEARKLFFDLKDGQSSYANSSRYYYAHLLYTDSNYREALSNFLPLQDDPSFGALVPYYLAHIYYTLEDYPKLIAVGEELIKKATDSRAPEIAKLVADAHYQQENYQQALTYLDIYDRKGGTLSPRYYFQRGYSEYKLGRYQSAIGSFNKITSGPQAMQQKTYYHLGDCYLQVGEKRQARNAFRAASEIEEDASIREDAFYNYAKLAYELADPFRDAIATLQEYLSSFPQSSHQAEVNAYLANLYLTTKNYPKALEAIEKAGLDDPRMQRVYQKIAFFRGNELFQNGQYEAALQQYRQSLDYPQEQRYRALALYWIAEVHYRLEELQEALDHHQRFRSSPGATLLEEFNRSFYNTGYCYYQLKDFAQAAENFRTYLQNDPEDQRRMADAYLRLGDSYFRTGGYLVAVKFYQKALDNKVQDQAYALFQKAQCLGLDGQTQSKIKTLQQLDRQFPQSEWVQEAAYEIALTHLRDDKYPQALQSFQDFKRDFPQSPRVADAILQEGLIYSNTDRNAQAIEQYRKVAAQFPGSEQALEAIRLAEIAYKRDQRVDDYLDWVATLDFVDFGRAQLDSTAYNAALESYSMNDWQDALNGFSSYIKRFKEGIFRRKALYYAARSAEELDQRESAMKYYQQVAGLPEHSYTIPALRYLAHGHLQDSAYAKARLEYRRLLKLEPKRPVQKKARMGILQAARRLGDYEEIRSIGHELLEEHQLSRQDYQDVLLARAQAAQKLNLPDTAIQEFRSLADTARGESQAIAYFNMAQLLHGQEEWQKSNEEINFLIENLPSYKEWKLRGLLLMARNYWKLEDIFQANYIIDFILKSDYSPQLNTRAQELRQDIKSAEARALSEKEKLMQEQSKGISLDSTEESLQMIDAPLEKTDSITAPQ